MESPDAGSTNTPNGGIPPVGIPPLTLADKDRFTPSEIPAKAVLKARSRLGLSGKRWTKLRLTTYEEFGQYLNVRIASRMMLVDSFDCMEQVQSALRWGQKIMDGVGPNGEKEWKYPDELKVAVGQMIAQVGKTFAEISKQVISLAEKGQEKQAGRRGGNLPPMAPGGTYAPIQINTQKVEIREPQQDKPDTALAALADE